MGTKLLLIDDDIDDRELFCEAIQALGGVLICYAEPNCRRAFENLDKKNMEHPEVIFLDINMPIMNGWECLRALKSHQAYKHIPVVMYSTSAEVEDVNKARKLGALCFLKKPTSFNGLKESLEVIVNHVKGAVLQPSELISI